MSKKNQDLVVCEDIKGKKYHVPKSKISFRPAVYGVVIKDNKVLLAKEWGKYDFPGGGIEIGEATEHALIREYKEETGLNVKVKNILYADNSFFKLPFDGNFVHSIHLYYECSLVGGKLSTEFFCDHEKKYAELAEWISLDKVKKNIFCSSVDPKLVLKKFIYEKN